MGLNPYISFIYPLTHAHIHLSTYPLTQTSIYPSTPIPIHPCIYPFTIHQPMYPSSIYLPIHPSFIYPFLHLSTHLPSYPSTQPHIHNLTCWFCKFLSVWADVNYLTSLYFSFFVYKMETIRRYTCVVSVRNLELIAIKYFKYNLIDLVSHFPVLRS